VSPDPHRQIAKFIRVIRVIRVIWGYIRVIRVFRMIRVMRVIRVIFIIRPASFICQVLCKSMNSMCACLRDIMQGVRVESRNTSTRVSSRPKEYLVGGNMGGGGDGEDDGEDGRDDWDDVGDDGMVWMMGWWGRWYGRMRRNVLSWRRHGVVVTSSLNITRGRGVAKKKEDR